jgi:hypothetical protein
VSLPAKAEARRRYLTAAQVEALADAAEERGRTVVLVLAYTGLRWVSWPRCASAGSISSVGGWTSPTRSADSLCGLPPERRTSAR